MRKLMTLAVVLGVSVSGLGLSGLAMAADGATLYKEKTCIACHGADANTPVMPMYPKLAGQNEQYALNQMKDIKSGKRNNSQTVAMKGVMHLSSDEDLAVIAKWLSGLPRDATPATAASGAGANLYTAKTCAACHGPDAQTPIMPLYPKLAGQNEEYALNQMKDIKSGARNNGMTVAMKGIMPMVSDEEMAAIAKWLSGLK